MNFMVYINSKCGQGGGEKNPRILRMSLIDAPFSFPACILYLARAVPFSYGATGPPRILGNVLDKILTVIKYTEVGKILKRNRSILGFLHSFHMMNMMHGGQMHVTFGSRDERAENSLSLPPSLSLYLSLPLSISLPALPLENDKRKADLPYGGIQI